MRERDVPYICKALVGDVVPIPIFPVFVIDNLVVGVSPVLIVKLLVPFVWSVNGILASLPCAIIELPEINSSAVAEPTSRVPTTTEFPVIVVAPVDKVPPIETAPVLAIVILIFSAALSSDDTG